jgi:hypothetical protein
MAKGLINYIFIRKTTKRSTVYICIQSFERTFRQPDLFATSRSDLNFLSQQNTRAFSSISELIPYCA